MKSFWQIIQLFNNLFIFLILSFIHNGVCISRLEVLNQKLARRHCPDEAYCALVTHLCDSDRGLVSEFIRYRCPCTCDGQRRIRSCCLNHGFSGECLKFCAAKDLEVKALQGKGVGCASRMHVWSYCVTEGRDQRKCCSANGVSEDSPCMHFCNGGKLPPVCSFKQIIDLISCAQTDFSRMAPCFQDPAPKFPIWKYQTLKFDSTCPKPISPISKNEVETFFNSTLR